MRNTLNLKDLSDESAQAVIKPAMEKAIEIGTKMDIAVSDALALAGAQALLD